MLNINIVIRLFLIILFGGLAACTQTSKIDREAVVNRHNPILTSIDWRSPFTLGNGRFAFTVDVTGLQSLPDDYYVNGTPLETKARWAWHSRPNQQGFTLNDTNVLYNAYDQQVNFPTNMDSVAGEWLRQNPHDLPLARVGLVYNGKAVEVKELSNIQQQMNLWQGRLNSRYKLDSHPVEVVTSVAGSSDTLAFSIQSPLLLEQKLGVMFAFPRGYDLQVKNTPKLIWNADEHQSKLVEQASRSALFLRQVDDHQHWVRLRWEGNAVLTRQTEHSYLLTASGKNQTAFKVTLQFAEDRAKLAPLNFDAALADAKAGWQQYWRTGAAIDFGGSRSAQAAELERRVILSQYLMGVQERADIPAQETGLTSSSWYGKFHTEMSWWHSAHWILWQRQEYAQNVLDWYVAHLPQARKTAEARGLAGARWSKMVGPDGRESPGGNPLIIWNQPQPIDLAERLYRASGDTAVLNRFAELVEQTATALSSMLVYEEDRQRYSLLPPIWIAQEHYDASESKNPGFELSYWRTALITAQKWRQRLGQQPNPLWQKQIEQLAALPQKDDKYVAIESIPDTFDNIESRNDHPAMLASWGLLQDERVDLKIMQNTLEAVLKNWDFETRIWGWDYPMIAMTASRLSQPQKAIDALLMDAHNNAYMVNGHVPQQKVRLPVYLPANGALLSAVAMMAATNPDSPTLGFPKDGKWQVKAEGFSSSPIQSVE